MSTAGLSVARIELGMELFEVLGSTVSAPSLEPQGSLVALERLLVNVDCNRQCRVVRVESVLVASDVQIRIHPAGEGQNGLEKLLTPAFEVLSPLAVLALGEPMVVLLGSPRTGSAVRRSLIYHEFDLSSAVG
jgi:hypothetical protein